jgi:hemerythrin-like domain-containing protein
MSLVRCNMDALSVLKSDHDEVRRLFDALDATSPRAHAERRELLERIRDEIEVHAAVEEEIFYPALEESSAAELRSAALRALEEHRVIAMLLEDLEPDFVEDEEQRARAAVLRKLVLSHADEEEKEMFRLVEREFDTQQLANLGQELEQRREELKLQPVPRI